MNWHPRSLSLIFPRCLSQWLGPLVGSGVTVSLVALALICSGWLDLTASTPHPEGWAVFLHFVFKRSVASHSAALDVPTEVYGDRLVRKGALLYVRECSNCHGAPGLGQSPVALAFRPTPQYLVAREDVYSPAELFWIIKHGVKYSAMPAWPAQSRDDEVWSVAAFVNRLPRISPAEYISLTSSPVVSRPAVAVAYDSTVVRRKFVVDDIDNAGDSSGKMTPVVAFGASTSGFALASCVGCHGSDGKGRNGTGIPNIALLRPQFIKAQLISFATGKRPSGYMQQVAAALTDRQMDQVATYYAGQAKQRTLTPSATPAVIARGETIIRFGIRSLGVSACANCHGEEGASAAGFSSLSGQHPAYLRDQIRLYRNGLRANGTHDPMDAVARKITDGDIDAVALAYAARQPSVGSPPTAR